MFAVAYGSKNAFPPLFLHEPAIAMIQLSLPIAVTTIRGGNDALRNNSSSQRLAAFFHPVIQKLEAFMIAQPPYFASSFIPCIIHALASFVRFSISSWLRFACSRAVCLDGTCLPFSKPGRARQRSTHFFSSGNSSMLIPAQAACRKVSLYPYRTPCNDI